MGKTKLLVITELNCPFTVSDYGGGGGGGVTAGTDVIPW